MGGESEKEGFAFPRTKTFITAVSALDPPPRLSPLHPPHGAGFSLRHEAVFLLSLSLSISFSCFLCWELFLILSFSTTSPFLLEQYGFLSFPLERAFLPSLFLCLASLILLHLASS